MTNTYLLEVIKAFRPEERQELSVFLDSPFFNNGGNAREIILLFEIIVAAAPDYLKEDLNKESVYFQIFHDQNIVEGKFEKLMSELNGLLRTYALTQQCLSTENYDARQILWSKWLRGRGLAERSKKVISRLKTHRGRQRMESLDLHRLDLQIAVEEHELASIQNRVKGDLNISELMLKLDLHYFNYRIELVNRYLLQQKAAQLPNIQTLEEGIAHEMMKSSLLQVSKNIFRILSSELPPAEDFLNLLHLLKGKEDIFPFETLTQFHAFLRSSCTLLINNGHIDFIPVLHQIHVDNLRRDYFFINGEISPHSYLNLVQIAIRANEFIWAKEFTEQYKKLIIGGDEDGFYYKLNLANCLFSLGDFDSALDYLPDSSSNFYHYQAIRRLELKIYYELNSELLLYKLDSFRKYIERTAPKTLSVQVREMNLNFLHILLQLAQSPPKDKNRSATLIMRVQNKKLVAERQWLLEKARELG